MAVTAWLIDKSALVRLDDSPDAEVWAARIERGLVRSRHHPTRGRLLGADRGPGALVFRTPPISMMPVEYLTAAD